MNCSDRKQLVRESSGSIEDQQHTTNCIGKMGSHTKLVSIAIFVCLGLIELTRCTPVDVIYTGDGCDCPTKLDFSVNVPSVPKPKKYRPSEYGYKIEVPKPRETKAKVSYSFDFEVEEPRPPKAVKPANQANLYATVDRVAIKKGDCEDSYAAAPPPSTCQCGQSAAVSAPFSRYVYNDKAQQPLLPPTHPQCKCQRQNCQCNLGRFMAPATTPYSPNTIFMGTYMLRDDKAHLLPIESYTRDEEQPYNNDNGGGGDGEVEDYEPVNVRRKRDLQHAFLRPRKLTHRRRPSRFVKLYRKNLADAPAAATPQRFFDLESLIQKQKRHYQEHQDRRGSLMRKTKRKAKKTPYALQRPRLVKREIKGEYDMLEKEREQLDLTLPEIIQFMPETLQPSFKRGQCYYGCGRSTQSPTSARESTEHEDNMSSKETELNTPASNYITYIDNETQTETATDLQSTTDEDGNNSADDKDETTDITNQDTDSDNGTIESLTNDLETNLDRDCEKRTSTEENLIKESKIASKRHAKNYHDLSSLSTAGGTKKYSATTLKTKKSAYNAHTPTASPISTNPNYKPQQNVKNARSATSAKIPTCESKKYKHQALTSTAPISRAASHDDNHAIPLRYASELDLPIPIIRAHDFVTPLHDHKYSIEFVDVKHLDKMIADIVYSHPEFLWATAHLGGALVDPPSWQDKEAIEYAKHLVDDRLKLLLGKENDFTIQDNIPSVPIPLYGVLPSML